MVIISSYPASPRRITVLVNLQAILLIFSGETSSNQDIFFTEDAAKQFFPTSKISAQDIRHQFFLIWSNLTIMAHIMGLGNQSESWKIIILSYKFTKRRYRWHGRLLWWTFIPSMGYQQYVNCCFVTRETWISSG